MTASATSPRPLRRDAQRNRDLILAAARAAFAAEGLDVPVEDIARRAGVGMGTLYRRFPSKEDLVDAVLVDAYAQYVELAEAALAAEDAWSGFCVFLEHALALHAENRGLKDVVATRERGRERAGAMRARVRPVLRKLIDRAQEQGALRADFTLEDIPLLFWTGGRVVEATSAVAPEVWRRYLGLMLDGLRADSATPLPQPPLTRSQLDRVTGTRHR
jgi:AcrR family transcriptional regulator